MMVEMIDKTAQLGLEVESYARSLGAEIYGVASAALYEEKFPRKPSPSKFLPGARSVIIVGLPFSRTIMDTVAAPVLADIYQSGAERTAGDGRHADSPPAGAERFYHGPENEMLTHELSLIAYKLSKKLTNDGHRSFYLPDTKTEPRFKTAPFYFMPAMYVAGMGQLGMNCAIITPKYGPRFRVTTVITDLELPAGVPMEDMKYPDCMTCKECVRRCPSKAIDGRFWKNVFKCSDYGCSTVCLSVCPAGEDGHPIPAR